MNAIGTIIFATALGSLITGCGAPESTENEDVASQTQALWGGEVSMGSLSVGSSVKIPCWSGKLGTHYVRIYTKDKTYSRLEVGLAYKHATDANYTEFSHLTVNSYVDSPYVAKHDSGTPDVGYEITVTNRSGATTTPYYNINTPW